MAWRTIVLCGFISGCVIHNSNDSDVFGHDFAITVGHAEVADHEPDGTLWDTDGSPPDPYAVLFVDGTQVLSTQNVSNSFTADWQDSTTRRIDAGTQIEVDLWDSDPIGMGDLIAKCGDTGSISADELRAGDLTCVEHGSLVQIFLDKVN